MSPHADESANRCPTSKPTARVEDAEHIALIVYHDLLCDEKGMPTEGAFQFSKLLLKSKNSAKYPHNRCGESEGVSVERAPASRENELLRRSKNFASARSTETKVQVSRGFAIANVGSLREIRFHTDEQIKKTKSIEIISASEQLVFVLADGGLANPYHSVLRLHERIDRPLHKKVVGRLMVAFVPFSDWNGC